MGVYYSTSSEPGELAKLNGRTLRDTIPVPDRAVALDALKGYCKGHGLRTSRDIQENVVRQTSKWSCSGAEVIKAAKERETGITGSPDIFLSYSWDAEQEPMLTTLTNFIPENFKFLYGERTPYGYDYTKIRIWQDVFAISQHANVSKDLKSLDKAISAAKAGTVLFLGTDAKPLNRIWCIFEVFKTIELNKPLTIMYTDMNKSQMPSAGANTAFMTLAGALDGTDVRNADATVADDKRLILGWIENSVGAARVNKTVREAIEQQTTKFLVEYYAARHPRQDRGAIERVVKQWASMLRDAARFSCNGDASKLRPRLEQVILKGRLNAYEFLCANLADDLFAGLRGPVKYNQVHEWDYIGSLKKARLLPTSWAPQG